MNRIILYRVTHLFKESSWVVEMRFCSEHVLGSLDPIKRFSSGNQGVFSHKTEFLHVL